MERKLPAADSNGKWSFKAREGGKVVKKTTDSRYEAIEGLTAEAMRYHRAVCDFLGSVDLAQFPGNTPLEQAMVLLKMLSLQKGGEAGTGGGEGSEPLPIFQENDNPEKVGEELNDLKNEVASLTEEEMEMMDPDGETSSDDGAEGDGKALSALKVAEKLADPDKQRLMLDISRIVNKFTKLQVRRQKRVVADPTGAERQTRPIEALSELPKLVPSAWALGAIDDDLFWRKAMNGELDVREKVTREDKKQAVFLLLDGSGSMGGRKHWKASGVVMHFLKAAAKGDCVVWLSVFDASLSDVKKAETPEEAKALIKEFLKGNYTGGNTDIGGSTKAAHAFLEKEIASGAALWKPEIVVLTDEDTSFSNCKASDVRGTTVHAFAMEVANPGLVKWAQSTGGMGKDNF